MMFGKSFARKNCCHFFLLKNQISNARRWQRTLTSTALWCALQEIIQRGRPPKPPPHHWRVGNFWSGRMSCAMAIWMCEKVTSCEVNYSGSYCESSVLKHGVWCLMFVKFNLLKRSSQKHHIIIAFLSHLFQFPDMFSCQKKAKRVCLKRHHTLTLDIPSPIMPTKTIKNQGMLPPKTSHVFWGSQGLIVPWPVDNWRLPQLNIPVARHVASDPRRRNITAPIPLFRWFCLGRK